MQKTEEGVTQYLEFVAAQFQGFIGNCITAWGAVSGEMPTDDASALLAMIRLEITLQELLSTHMEEHLKTPGLPISQMEAYRTLVKAHISEDQSPIILTA